MGMRNVLSRFREGTVFKPTGNRIANLQLQKLQWWLVSESGEMCFLKPGNVAHQNVIQNPRFDCFCLLDSFYLKIKNNVVLVSWKNYVVCQSITVN